MAREVCVSVPGRICLVGEHLDWMNEPVITCAIDALRVYVRMSHTEECLTTVATGAPFHMTDAFDSGQPIVFAGAPLDHVRAAVAALQGTSQTIPNVRIDIQTRLPAGVGLSSSAALLVATIAAYNQFFNWGLPRATVCDLAYQAEATYLRTGCGQMDQYACGLGGLVYIDCATTPPRRIASLVPRSDVAIVLADTGTRRAARDVLAALRRRYELGDRSLLSYRNATKCAVEDLRRHLAYPQWDPTAVGRMLNTAHAAMRDHAGLSTELIESCIRAALDAGALGAKLTGAGGGGCVLALTLAADSGRVERGFSGTGATVLTSHLAGRGLRSEAKKSYDRLATVSQ